MERFVKGDIVVVLFPFSDLSGKKKRPALIAKSISGNDFILCQITHKSHENTEEIELKKNDLNDGKLSKDSFIRFSKLFTIDQSLIEYKIGSIKTGKFEKIIDKICSFLKIN